MVFLYVCLLILIIAVIIVQRKSTTTHLPDPGSKEQTLDLPPTSAVEQGNVQDGIDKLVTVFKKFNIPYLAYIKLTRKKSKKKDQYNDVEIHLATWVNQEIWLITLSTWAGKIHGHRNQDTWTQSYKYEGELLKFDTPNLVWDLKEGHDIVQRMAKSKKVKTVKIRSILVLVYATAHIDALHKNESVFSLKQFKAFIKQEKLKSVDEKKDGIKALWNSLAQKVNRKET